MTESTAVDRPVLEDVAEEEDLFAAAGSSASGCYQVKYGEAVYVSFTSCQDFHFHCTTWLNEWDNDIRSKQRMFR